MSYLSNSVKSVILALIVGVLASLPAMAEAASNELFVYDRSIYTLSTVGGQSTIYYRNRVYSVNPAAGTLNRLVREWGISSNSVDPKPGWDSEPNSNPYISTTTNSYPGNPSYGMAGGDGRLYMFDGTGATLLNGNRLLRAIFYGLETNQGNEVFRNDYSGNTTLTSTVSSGGIAYVPESDQQSGPYHYLLTNESISKLIQVKKDGTSPVPLSFSRPADTIPPNKGYLPPAAGTVRGCMTYGAGYLWIFDNNLQRLSKVVPVKAAVVAQYWLPFSFKDGLTQKVPRGEGLAFDEATQTLYLWDGLTKNGQNYLWPIPLSTLTATSVGTYQPIMQTWTSARPITENPLFVIGMSYAGTLPVQPTPTVSLIPVVGPGLPTVEDSANLLLQVRSDQVVSQALTVYLNPPTGTATNGVDYPTAPLSLTIPAGSQFSNSQYLTFIDDAAPEPTETVSVSIKSDPRYFIGVSSVGMSVDDNDQPTTVTIAPSGAQQISEGPGQSFSFEVRRVLDHSLGHNFAPLTVNYRIVGTASEGADYQAIAVKQATFGYSATSTTFAVTLLDDALAEPTETLIVEILPGTGYVIGAAASVTDQILDNEPASLTVSAPDASGKEGGNHISFRITRTGNPSVALPVNFAWSGSATNGSDYTAPTSPISIPAGQTVVDLAVTVTDDSSAELQENVILTVQTGTGYVLGSPSTATATVDDNEAPVVTIAALDTKGKEGGSDNASFRLTRLGERSTAITVNLLTEATSAATSGSDYTSIGTTKSIAANTATADVAVTVLEDTTAESTETVVLTVATGTGYTPGPTKTATVTIEDNETPQVAIAVSGTAKEGATNTGKFTVSRLGDRAPALSVVVTWSGSATSASDFNALPNPVSLAATVASVDVPVPIIDDTTAEVRETLSGKIETGTGYVPGTVTTATLNIDDNEANVVTIAANDNKGKEGGTDNGSFRLTRLGDFSAAITVNLVIEPTSSATTSDYTAIALTKAIGASTNTADIAVTVTNDTTTEADETVLLTVAAGTGYTVSTTKTATVTIEDNETPSLGIVANDATATEAGLTTGEFTITRLGDKAPALTINRVFTGSTASNGTDFQSLGGTIALAAGQTTVKFLLTPIDDTQMEPTESVITTLTTGTGYVVGTSNIATVNITDNDTQTVSVAMLTNASEPATNGAFRFTRTGNTAGALVVTVALTTGPTYATNGTDHQPIPTTVNFAAGQLTVDVPVTVIDDANYEGSELVKLTIQPQSTYVVGSQSNATVTLADNDKPTVTVSLIDGTANEPSDTGTFRLTRNGILTLGGLAVKYQMTGRAINGTDYTLLSGTAPIAQGNSYVDVVLSPLPDEIIEGIETAILTIQVDAANYNVGSPSVATVSIGSSIIDTIAGQGPLAYTPTPTMGGQATATGLATPTGLAVDATGNRYVVDGDANAVLKINASGVISRFAGNASWTSGFAGDGGPASSATLNGPRGVAVDAAGNVYIADTNNHRIRKVTVSTGIITTIAGRGAPRLTGDGGAATAAFLNAPQGVAIDAGGNVYIADTQNRRIRKITVSTGVITSVAGSAATALGDGGAATAASVSAAQSVAVDASGNLYIADTGNHRIRKVTVSTGIITTIAGNGTGGYAGDNGPATSAQIQSPEGVAISEFGEVFIADTANNRIRKLEGTVIVTVAGNGLENWTGDGGAATSASLFHPGGLAFDATGNLYVADSWNSSIRRLRAGISAIAMRRLDHPVGVLLASTWALPEPR
jgi:NHL repeat/Calx-beta domain